MANNPQRAELKKPASRPRRLPMTKGDEARSATRSPGSAPEQPPRFHKLQLKPSGSPDLHPDLVRRAALLKWLLAHQTEPVVTIVAPAGYGKTTLLAQAEATDPRPFAWVSLEDGDNDPVVLMTHLAEALDRITKVGPGVFDALRLPAGSLWSKSVPRLGAALASIERPAVIVLDDVHALRERDSLDVLAAISGYLPRG